MKVETKCEHVPLHIMRVQPLVFGKIIGAWDDVA